MYSLFISEVKDDGSVIEGEVILSIASKWHVWVILGAVVTAIFACLMYGLFVLLTMSRPGEEDNFANLRGKMKLIEENYKNKI